MANKINLTIAMRLRSRALYRDFKELYQSRIVVINPEGSLRLDDAEVNCEGDEFFPGIMTYAKPKQDYVWLNKTRKYRLENFTLTIDEDEMGAQLDISASGEGAHCMLSGIIDEVMFMQKHISYKIEVGLEPLDE